MAVVRWAPSRDEDCGPRSHVMSQRRGATGYRGRSLSGSVSDHVRRQ